MRRRKNLLCDGLPSFRGESQFPAFDQKRASWESRKALLARRSALLSAHVAASTHRLGGPSLLANELELWGKHASIFYHHYGGWGTPWTGWHTPTDSVELPVNLTCASLDCEGEAGVSGENPRRHGENMQTPQRKTPVGIETHCMAQC